MVNSINSATIPDFACSNSPHLLQRLLPLLFVLKILFIWKGTSRKRNFSVWLLRSKLRTTPKAVSWAFKLDAHGMRPMRFLSACGWFRDVTSFFDASGMVCGRVGTCFYIDASDSLLWLTFTRTQTIPDASEKDVTSRNQTHAPKNAQDACRVYPALLKKIDFSLIIEFGDIFSFV